VLLAAVNKNKLHIPPLHKAHKSVTLKPTNNRESFYKAHKEYCSKVSRNKKNN
jgi:hypothetical protein